MRNSDLGRPAVAAVAALGLVAGCDLFSPPQGEDSLGFEPGGISLQAVESSTDPVEQTVGLRFDGAGTISWNSACDQPWLTVSPPTGSMSSTATMSLRIAADPTGLSVGLHNGTVTAAAVAGEVRSATLAVEFEITQGGPTAPAITTQPSDRTVTEREDATFTVAATGDAPITYQWQRDGKDIPCATKPSFTVFSASVAVSGTQYSCVVSNGAGSVASNAATLTVNMAPPILYEQPHDRAVVPTEGAEFSVYAQGSGNVTYQWQRDGLDIPDATSWRYMLPSAGVGDDGAVFTCVVSNEAGSVTSDPATLTVAQLAILTPAIPGALVGVDYSFQLQGAPPYTWTLTNGTLPPGLIFEPWGQIHGNSAVLGGESITVKMDDGLSSVTKDFTITVHEPAIVIGIQEPGYTLDYIWGEPGKPLTATLTATGGTGPYTWSVQLGGLPDGLSLDPSTGAISGSPPRGGLKRVLVQVTDDGGRSNLATVTFSINALGPDMPRLVNVTTIWDAEGIPRMAITVWRASPMQSVTVDALFMNSNYPTRLQGFTPPTTPEFVSALPSLGPGEEMWELPALDGGVYLNRRILTDSQGRTTVLNTGSFEVFFGPRGAWPLHDSDGDGVPDSCDTVAGDDPSDALAIHRDVVLRDIDPGDDLAPPEIARIDIITVGVPGAQSARLMYSLSDDSFIAGGEVYVGFTGTSPLEMVTVPLAFHCIAQPDPDFLKGFPGGERWVLPYIPSDYEIHGARFWDCHGNVLEWGMDYIDMYHVQSTVPVPTTDTDVDGIDDGWEQENFGDLSRNGTGDYDGDGYTDMDEYIFRSNPTDGASVPITHDSDFDGVPDVLDPDDPTSYVSRHAPLPTNVLKNHDSDSDGMPDIWESCHALDPSSPADAAGDLDVDGLSNLDEFLQGNDPYDADSDDDGTGDATDDGMGSFVDSRLAWQDSVYTSTGVVATRTQVSASESRYDGTCSVAATFSSAYPLAWVKVKVRLYPTGKIILVDAVKVLDPSVYDMWWITDQEVWAAGPVGEYFEPAGYFASDTHGRVTGY